MSLDSVIKKALLIGAFTTSFFFNPLSSNNVQAQAQSPDSGYFSDKDVADLLAAMDKKEKESHITLEDKAYDDQWINRMIAEVYFPLSKKYDADTTNAIMRGYAHMGVDVDGSRLKLLQKAADGILSDPYVKTMPKDVANSVIIASGFWAERPLRPIEAAKAFADSLSKKGIDFRKDTSGLCAMIEAHAATFTTPEPISTIYFSYDGKSIDRKDFIKAYAYSMYVGTRPAGTNLTDRYMVKKDKILETATSLISDFDISIPIAGKLMQVAVLANMDLSEIIDFYGIFKDLPKKYNEGIIGDIMIPYRYSSENMNKKRLAENFMYVFDSLTDRGFDEKTVRAMIQSYTINPMKK